MNRRLIEQRKVSATGEREIAKNIFVVAPGVWRLKDIFVNIFLVQNTENGSSVLVDTGLKSSAPKIKQMMQEALGNTTHPVSIIMTHGHFDHTGSLAQLAEEWNVPVYCHRMEMPYLSGKSSYPPPDPTVGGGIMPTLSLLFPRGPIDVHEHLYELPQDNSVPDLSGWKWIFTPGHAPGHISLFREEDGVLIAGDAFVTTKQESAFSIMTQKKILSGPPKYFTADWGSAARSVKALAAIEPHVLATGHGQTMYGEDARKALHKLAREFWRLGMPESGRYVKEPALFTPDGVSYTPKVRLNYSFMAAIGVSLFAIATVIYLKRRRQSKLF